MSDHEHQHERGPGMHEALVWASYFLVASVILWVPKLLGLAEILIGLPPILFMAYVLHRSYRAKRARRAEESNDILDAGHAVHMCKIMLDLLDDLVRSPGDPRVRAALDLLYCKIDALTSRYRRYLDDEAVKSALEAEEGILRAGLGEERKIAARLAPVRARIKAVRDGILDVDHRRLRDARGRV
ncbi:MAG: hypothetical protein OXU37_06495 [Thaumarchaeota archaeon]|nr:hypothetical protein [Nitrososphaerota archaeon]